MSNRPPATEVPPYYQNYVALVPEEDITAALAEQAKKTHFTDAERIFAYRALAIARGETKSLPGFDEKAYADAGDFDRRFIRDLADDYEAARRSTIALFRGLSDEAWKRHGIANDQPVHVRTLAYITLGHERHHLKVLRERYGVA